MKDPETISVEADQFAVVLERYIGGLGYRLDMIMPSDAPREALLQKPDREGGLMLRVTQEPSLTVVPPHSEWTVGRAGMMYRNLIPGFFGSTLVASHIRILNGGEVPDSVHYHKIDFQIIYCLKGAIRVVYQDQGEPFWLRPGDCVLQPPEIRHRVLEAEAGSEVIEITSPAEHETWFDHEMILPTDSCAPDRTFGTQRFVRHRDDEAVWEKDDGTGTMSVRTQLFASGKGAPDVYTIKSNVRDETIVANGQEVEILIGGRGVKISLSD